MSLPEQIENKGEVVLAAAKDFVAESQDYFETTHLDGTTVLGIASESTAVLVVQGEEAMSILETIREGLLELFNENAQGSN